MPFSIRDMSLADKTQDLQKFKSLSLCLGGRCLDTSAVSRCVWPILWARKGNEWHFQTSHGSTPPFTVAMTAAAAWLHRCPGKGVEPSVPSSQVMLQTVPARQKVLPSRISADASSCRPCCRAPIAATKSWCLSSQLTKLCFQSSQVALPLLNYLKGKFVDWSNPV